MACDNSTIKPPHHFNDTELLTVLGNHGRGQNAADNQSKLLSVINDLFTYVIDPYSGKKVIRVNPKLTDESLQKSVEKSRQFIVDLYIKCEMDYVNGVKLYEAIVESKILDTTQKQIETLKNEANKIIKETKQISVPVPAPAPIPSVSQQPVIVNVPSIKSSLSTSSTVPSSTSSIPSYTPSTVSTSSSIPSYTSTIPSSTVSTSSSIPSYTSSTAIPNNNQQPFPLQNINKVNYPNVDNLNRVQ